MPAGVAATAATAAKATVLARLRNKQPIPVITITPPPDLTLVFSAANPPTPSVESPTMTASKEPEAVQQRGVWARKAEFILSCMGYAIGIGNVWRFPYLCYRSGGGAFLVPYLITLFVCGIPLFFMETALGQFSNTGCITVFRICPLFKGAGFAMAAVNFIVSMYYNVLLSYSLYFLVMCFQPALPWEECDNPWNTEKCVKVRQQANATDVSREVKSSGDEFFHHFILQISPGIDQPGHLVWQLVLSDFVSWLILFACTCKGVKSVGKVVYFTATFPFVILFALFVRGVTLPGAAEGIRFYMTPQWEKLADLKVWADACTQIFISLGPGWGGLINMASYNKFRNDNKMDSYLVPILNSGTSIFAGFVVFSVLGFMSHKTGVPVSTVATEGPGLAFVTYPEAISMLPAPHLWAVLFFFMLYLLGMDSCFVQVESIISSVTDEYPSLRKHKMLITALSCAAMFTGSLSCVTNGGMYVLQLLDAYTAAVTVVVICILEVIIVNCIYGFKNFVRDVEFMIKKKISLPLKICLQYVTPIVLLFILTTTLAFNTQVTYNKVPYPYWAVAVGCLSAVLCMIWIPIYMIYKVQITPGPFWKRITTNLRYTDEWGPEIPEHRAAWDEIVSGIK